MSGFEVWTKDAIDQDRWVLGGLSASQASTLMQSLEAIYPGVPTWSEEE